MSNEISEEDKKSMRLAVERSKKNIEEGGGPFGAVIVKDGKLIAEGGNRVVPTLDPTAHAEICCIRKACQELKDFSLKGCVLYTSCEPCPMCLSAIYWARIDKIFYANTRHDAKNINFDDSLIYDEVKKELHERIIPIIKVDDSEAIKVFHLWHNKNDKIHY